MAAPVHEAGTAVGSLGVGSRRPGREYDARDQQVLLSFAEHASLALNHARAIEEAVHEALHDSLTGLPNRSLFLDRLRHAVARAERTDTPVAVLFCDLDGFKTVNDSLGHRTGDRLLVLVAERLADCLRPTDTIARLGGRRVRGPARGASRSRATPRARPSGCSTRSRRRSSFAGASSSSAPASGSPPEPRRPETLLRDADLAMYRAKSPGQGPLRDLRARHAHGDRRSPRPRGRPEAGDRARRAGARLPADLQPPNRRRGGSRGTGSLAAPHPGHGPAGAVRAAGRGERPDPRAGPLGACGRRATRERSGGPSTRGIRGSRSASTSPAPSSASRVSWTRSRRPSRPRSWRLPASRSRSPRRR